ncbi:MAG: peptidase M15 [Rhodopseudomonas sp.]|nr:peptidase M15 [Rhodopseudomonas sp.]
MLRRKDSVQRDIRSVGRDRSATGLLTAPRRLIATRVSLAALSLLMAATAITATPGEADARSRRHRSHAATATKYSPPYASIVVDSNTGAVMQATNADSPRHPASLTKMMTLYLLFERLEAGKIKLNSELPVSAHAAAQAPSKLGLKPGDTIKVETAIEAIVTKSANDVAVSIGEALGGDEVSFSKLMNAKARALGMTHTTYRNASGLPDDEQVTTARDQALLGRALQDRFPRYFHYFSTRSFTYEGRTVRGHNRLLGSVDGVDGIKTGYIHASGFNIVTSVNRDHRHIVAVVFGGVTARARDAQVRSLIASTINKASTRRTAPPVAEGTAMAEVRLPAKLPASPPAPAHDPRDDVRSTTGVATASPAPGSTAPIKPTAVQTYIVHPGNIRLAALSPMPSGSRKLTPAPATASPAVVTTIATKKSEPPPPPGAGPGILGVLSMADARAASEAPPVKPRGNPQVAAVAPVPMPAPEPSAKPRGGWMIQVGAFPDETAAKQRLTAAQAKAKTQLVSADPFTEKVEKGRQSLYRARFGGLDKGQAETACKYLKLNEIPCMLLKN